MRPEPDHVILTRFNLPSVGVESIIRAKEGWLRHRIELFERFCLPSVQAQTNRNFHWLIYFDPESPSWLKERIQVHRREGSYVPVFRQAVSRSDLLADLQSVTGGRGSCLITSNLDNDDGLAADFVERLQSAGRRNERTALYLSRGLIRNEGRLYLRTDASNAFCSVQEPWNGAATCWSDWHTLLGRSMPVLALDGRPGWLQVVHGENVSNRVHGRLVGASEYRNLFPGMLADLPEPGSLELIRDLLFDRPARASKDAVRRVAKTAALSLLGKDGLDRTKLALSSAAQAWRPSPSAGRK